MKIAIVGLGYVGLPLAIRFARSCVSVLGIDVDPQKVESLNLGRSYIRHIGSADVAKLLRSKKFLASTDFSLIREVEAVIICVPTPLNKNREPDLSYVLETARAIASYLGPDHRTPRPRPFPRRAGEEAGNPQPKLVVLESTTYPGTTEEDLRAVLEEGSGLKAGVEFHLAFSPEREDPANQQSELKRVPKI